MIEHGERSALRKVGCQVHARANKTIKGKSQRSGEKHVEHGSSKGDASALTKRNPRRCEIRGALHRGLCDCLEVTIILPVADIRNAIATRDGTDLKDHL